MSVINLAVVFIFGVSEMAMHASAAHVSIGGLYRRHARQSVRRNLDNSHLIRRQAENV
jgi:hypothetical protein